MFINVSQGPELDWEHPWARHGAPGAAQQAQHAFGVGRAAQPHARRGLRERAAGEAHHRAAFAVLARGGGVGERDAAVAVGNSQRDQQVGGDLVRARVDVATLRALGATIEVQT